jgi:hypothetical protein
VKVDVKRMNIPSDESKNVLDVDKLSNIILTAYEDETQLGAIMGLISEELSEPYSIYTYRYFVYNWPKLTILVS